MKKTRKPSAFKDATYSSQIRRLRALSKVALSEFPIKVKTISLINHGENTTFKIKSSDGKKYVLRIHRSDYHSSKGLLEEFRWMNTLKMDGLSLPFPILSKKGSPIVSVSSPEIGQPRHCDLLEWVEGHFKEKGLSPKHLYALGKLIAKIHSKSRYFKSKHRTTWTAEDMLGKSAKFGSLSQIDGATSSQLKIIRSGQLKYLKILKDLEHRFPNRMGMIHSDLHFGNLLWTRSSIGIIDFDDCGYGFFMQDLATPAWMIQLNKKISPESKELLVQALLEGYSSEIPMDDHDRKMLEHFAVVRELMILAWLQSRRDNPKLHPNMKRAIERTMVALTVKGKDRS